MAMAKTGIVKIVANWSRRFMSRSSVSSARSVTIGIVGSSAIPQLGQAPGASRTTSGCIGQVQVISVGTVMERYRLRGF
jgi:hypothetical protein